MSSPKVTYSYANGSSNTIRPTSVTYPDGRVLAYNYGTAGGMNDRLSRVESLSFDGTGNLVQPAYLGLGTQVRTTLNQPQVRWDLATGSSPNPYAGLDRFGRVIDSKWTNYNTSATLDQIKYTYDRASNRTSRENVVAKAQTTPKYFDELYGYDGSNRLSLMERGQLAGSPPSSVTNKQFSQDWGLDPTGNWKVFKEDANGDGTWELNQTRTSNPVNEITAINETAGPSWVTPGYDSAGNMTTIPRPAEPTGEFTGIYDAWNRLVELRGLDDTVVGRYEYDGLTRRIVKHTFPGWVELELADWDAMTLEDWNRFQLTQSHRRDYYYNVAWQILEERADGGIDFDRQYVWGLQYIDGLVFRDRQLTLSVERNYALQDANWNVTALTDDNGAVVERYSYSAYGVPSFLNPDFTPAANNEAYDWDVLYAGYKWDSESALYQVRYRYLQPTIGTWGSRDPIGYTGGDVNLFNYVSNNPIISIDDSGLINPAVFGPTLPRTFEELSTREIRGSIGKKEGCANDAFQAVFVAKSFINGIPDPGEIKIDRKVRYPNNKYAVLLRYQIYQRLVGDLEPFNQNPDTDAQDGLYRMFTKLDVRFNCCNHTVTDYWIKPDMEGGQEGPGIFGTINLDGVDTVGPQISTNNGILKILWRGWGRPNSIAEPGMVFVQDRTSVNIWHTAEVELSCENGKGRHAITSFAGSKFPSHRLWVNGGKAIRDIPQGPLNSLWNASKGDKTFVD